MNISGLLGLFDRLPAYGNLANDLRKQEHSRPPLGLLRAARPVLIAALMRDLDRPLMVVCGLVEETAALLESLRAWSGSNRPILRLPEPLPHFFERAPWSRETASGRLRVLTTLARINPEAAPVEIGARKDAGSAADLPPVILSSVRALIQPTMPRRQFRLGTRILRPGQLLDLEGTLATWIGLGYQSTPVVDAPGEFSRRGGIIDVFPPAGSTPVRIELFGDEVESLRHFDPATQRSEELIEQALITPATEALPRFGPRVAEQLATWDLSVLSDDDAEVFQRDRENLLNGVGFSGIEFYLPLLYSHPDTVLDYFPADGLVVLTDHEEVTATWAELERHAAQLGESAAESGLVPPGYSQPYISCQRWTETLHQRLVLVLGYGSPDEVTCGPDGGREENAGDGRPEETEASVREALRGPFPESEQDDGPEEILVEGVPSALSRAFSPGPRFGGQLKPLVAHIRAALAAGEHVVIASRQAQRLAELWSQEEDYAAPRSVLTKVPRSHLTFLQGALADGWGLTLPRSQWHLLTDAEIFGWARPQPRRRRRRKVAPETYYADMTPGDYVVHIEHGIGIFRGLTTVELEGLEREYLLVQYEGSGRIYVPIHQADRISRYIGADDRPPRLNRLGSADWGRVRQQAEQAVAEVAEELLALYAERETAPGHAFGSDTAWQAELEAAFPYIETEDQLRAIDEVKSDMEEPKPMDRLICGDVGYGKTEVALRAAFKAVMDGKQVAVLVPTTVLAQQHFNTFRERLQPFPVVVEMLSRFRSRQEQAQVLDRLSKGQVDIVIGTHRLLSKDVTFKDLGLLIVDEEQRFGVTHKERLKQLRTEVDVLTMTATPIPRTLYMSLTGVRDISTIDTPPEERLPVRTFVGQYDDDVVRHAILREVDRGGQVFFVHNRVMGMEQIRRRLQQVVPEVTIGVAHGQMRETGLERVMLRFVNQEIDVLLCTSIIESGLDIPNANTLIVNRADQFGLAQLYQLRGRVGRGAQRAYAYFFYDNPRRLTEDARRRLETIREASELGAGFTIAMRDLEIRGAGDILGTRQHGQISAVGFDLYTRLLAQSVRQLRAQETGETVPPALPAPITINLPLAAFIPADYVVENTLRLRLYRRMGGLATLDEVDTFAEELADRFGPIPDGVDNLLYQLRLKVLAGTAGVEGISVEDGKIAVRSLRLEMVNRVALQRRLGRGARVSRRAVWVPFAGLSEQQWRVLLVQVLEALAEL
jgi:transcription-repair coupling factor (superfamily II helicase)